MSIIDDMFERLNADPTPSNVRRARKALDERRDIYGPDEVRDIERRYPALFSDNGCPPTSLRFDTKTTIAIVASVTVPFGLLVFLITRDKSGSDQSGTSAAGSKLIVKNKRGSLGNYRVAPGLKSQKLGELPNGTKVDVLGSQLDGRQRWYHIDAGGGKTGWMHSDILVPLVSEVVSVVA